MRRLAPLAAAALFACPSPADDDDDTPTPAVDDDDAADDDDFTYDGLDFTDVPPCTRWGSPEDGGEVEDDDLDEISGLAVSRRHPDLLWVHMDSGADEPELSLLDDDGDTIGTAVLPFQNIDWEDMAIGPCTPLGGTCLWIADIGDNGEDRGSVGLIRLEEPIDIPGTDAFRIALGGQRFPFEYPDGAQDAEALAIAPDGAPVVFTKREDGTTRAYRFDPATLVAGGDNEPVLVAQFETTPPELGGGLPAAVTAADMWPDGSRLLIRTYGQTREFEVPNGDLSAVSLQRSTQVFTAIELQGEAIAYDPFTRGVRHVAESENPPLWHLPCTDGLGD